ncbi:MAG: type II toxin-antitoxin system HicB family antitoxin [Defluviitaleaceae bacterium]|nr:type II toxin-antitoxin system HicB family antitoxin [Defluviitaleaceae bacterium]
MRILTYFAVFEPNGKGGYGVYFPDIAGCTSYGDNFKHAQSMAKEALGLHLYEMEKDEDALPVPTLDAGILNIDPATAAGYVISDITVYPDMIKNQLDNRAVKTNTTLPAWLKELAESRNVNFSHVLQAALKEQLGIGA